MIILDENIKCSAKSRLEIFPFGDCHIGKRNCDEGAIKKQVDEILKRAKHPKRIVRVILCGDIINAISPSDVRRFDFNELADWFLEGDATNARDKLGDMVVQEVCRAADIFKPIRQYILGAITGNHEKQLQKHQNVNVHKALCNQLKIRDLSDETFIRFTFHGHPNPNSICKLYVRHGYGGGRTPGAEPNKLARMLNEWESADVCLSGHSHTFCMNPPKAILHLPDKGKIPKRMIIKHRFAANWGCWLLSHLEGEGSYESASCYEAKPMMTVKVVIWPFWETPKKQGYSVPKIELRQYPII